MIKMREIKFRAWDGKKMIFYNYWFTLHGQSVLCFEEKEEHSYVDESDVDSPDRVILQQYTGLKDKNGKEIYEGDIVKALKQEQDGSNSYEIKDIIRQERGGFKVFGRSMQDCYTQQDCVSIKNFIWCQYGHMNVRDIYYEILKVEVIGNIYENPELLEEK